MRKHIKSTINHYNEILEPNLRSTPRLGYILIGDKPENELYVRLKTIACEELGFEHEGIVLSTDISEQELIEQTANLGNSQSISGIILQLPFPAHIDLARILTHIPPAKDVDGLHPFNIGTLAMKNHRPHFESCTPLAVLELIKRAGIDELAGKKICLVGRSNIVGMPLFLLLTQRHNACVTLCHSRTSEEDVKKALKDAEIVIAACGIPNYIKSEWLGEGQVVIDVGVTYALRDGEENLFGDVEFNEETLQKVRKITPVPGGVGPMTITMLMNNLSVAWTRQSQELMVNKQSFGSL